MSEIEQARQEHSQASRNVRRLEQEAATRYPMWNIRDRTAAKEHQQKAADELTRLLDGQMFAPLATRPDGAESRHDTGPNTQLQPQPQRT